MRKSRLGIIDKHVMLHLLSFCNFPLMSPEMQKRKSEKNSSPKVAQKADSNQ